MDRWAGWRTRPGPARAPAQQRETFAVSESWPDPLRRRRDLDPGLRASRDAGIVVTRARAVVPVTRRRFTRLLCVHRRPHYDRRSVVVIRSVPPAGAPAPAGAAEEHASAAIVPIAAVPVAVAAVPVATVSVAAAAVPAVAAVPAAAAVATASWAAATLLSTRVGVKQ